MREWGGEKWGVGGCRSREMKDRGREGGGMCLEWRGRKSEGMGGEKWGVGGCRSREMKDRGRGRGKEGGSECVRSGEGERVREGVRGVGGLGGADRKDSGGGWERGEKAAKGVRIHGGKERGRKVIFFLSVQLSHCEWLKCPSPSSHGRPHPPRPHLFQKFLLWLMNEVVIKCIKVRSKLNSSKSIRDCLS